MSLSDTERKGTSGAVVSNTANTRLTGSWFLIARIVWLALVVPSLGLFVVSLPVYYQQLLRACVDATTCNISGSLPTIGFASGYAALSTILSAITAAIWCGVGFLIFWRRSNDWLALLAAFVLVMYIITSPGTPLSVLAFASPVLALPLSLVSFLGQVSFGAFLLLFPNGRLIPRWMGLILLLDIIQVFFDNFPSPISPFDANWPAWLNLLVYLVIYGTIVFSQIYRYRRVSTPVQRQQTKWVILGVASALGVVLGLIAVGVLIPSLLNTLFWNTVWSIIYPVALLLIPLSIGFSILRYRLYDIDVLINRTLVYGTLTVSLVLVYFGLVLGLQFLFDRLMGLAVANSPWILVGSTLAIAALFQPLRHSIQNVIDRRFYRSKYDAAKVVASFSATLRQEVELAQLRAQLLEAVQETMQPAHVSLWLNKSGKTQPGYHEDSSVTHIS